MSSTLFYDTTRTVTPDMVDVNVDRNFFYHHRWTPENYQAFVEEVKQLPSIVEKVNRHVILYEKEQALYDKFFGQYGPTLELNPDGTLDISDGRHRMLAMKDAGISLELPVRSYVHIEQVADISKLYPSRKHLFFRKKDDLDQKSIRYIFAKVAIENSRKLDEKGYFVEELQDKISGKSYVFVSKDQIRNEKGFRVLLEDFQERNIPIYISRENVYGKDKNEEAQR